MEINTRAIGKMANSVVKENTFNSKIQPTRDSSSKVNIMVLASWSTKTATNTKATSSSEKNMDRANMTGLMVITTTESGGMIVPRVMALP